MTVLILCAGESKRFDYNGVSKHRLMVHGEELLSRIVRQCKEHTQLYNDEISIVTNDFEITYGLNGHSMFTPEKYRYTCQTLKSTYDIWTSRMVVLLGDVLYSDELMRDIFRGLPRVMFYGDTKVREIYALVFTNQGEIIRALDQVDRRVEEGYHGQLWQLFYTLHGLPPDHHPNFIPRNMFQDVTDFTQDFDTLHEYEFFLGLGGKT